MSTSAQLAANRLNAEGSTGPVTDAGKSASSQNSRKHGCAAGFSILPAEDPDEFNALLDRINEEMKPATEHECFLVDQMTQARWKLERIRGIEEELLEKVLAGEPAENQLALMMRYSAAAERSYYKAHKELTLARREREKSGQAEFKNAIEQYLKPPAGHATAAVVSIRTPELASFGNVANRPAPERGGTSS